MNFFIRFLKWWRCQLNPDVVFERTCRDGYFWTRMNNASSGISVREYEDDITNEITKEMLLKGEPVIRDFPTPDLMDEKK